MSKDNVLTAINQRWLNAVAKQSYLKETALLEFTKFKTSSFQSGKINSYQLCVTGKFPTNSTCTIIPQCIASTFKHYQASVWRNCLSLQPSQKKRFACSIQNRRRFSNQQQTLIKKAQQEIALLSSRMQPVSSYILSPWIERWTSFGNGIAYRFILTLKTS